MKDWFVKNTRKINRNARYIKLNKAKSNIVIRTVENRPIRLLNTRVFMREDGHEQRIHIQVGSQECLHFQSPPKDK